MADEGVSLYRQTLANRQYRYDAAISSGEFTPFLYPWDTLPALYLFLAVAVTPRLPIKLAGVARYAAFILILCHGAYVVTHRRTLWFAGGYGIGLSSAWGAIMSGAVLVCNDVARDFRRLETRPLKSMTADDLQNGSTTKSTSSEVRQKLDLRRRKVASVYTSTDIKQIPSTGFEKPATDPYRLVWQGFPYGSSWLHLVDWTVDLITSFRGVGWKHRISTAGQIDAPLPADESEKEYGAGTKGESAPTSVSSQNLRSLQLRALQDLIVNYLLLDLLKTTMITDPYFFGVAPLASTTPWQWLARTNDIVPIVTRFVRLTMSLAGVIGALTTIFSLSPLFFATILPALVDVSEITKAPLLEPGLYPPMWYPLTASVMYSGLAGLWGKFWHQMFRFGISEPSRVLIKRLNMNPRGNSARVIQILVAFGLSGSIHALGSYTTFSLQGSHPLSGAFMFFLSQGVGVFLQSTAVKLLHKNMAWITSLPSAVGMTVNVVFVLVCLYFTGPLLANDLAGSGVWLYEPLPISPLRGLGFGPGGKDEGWWTWYQEGSQLLSWWKGDRWWHGALAIY